jgi:hypothetical protein
MVSSSISESNNCSHRHSIVISAPLRRLHQTGGTCAGVQHRLTHLLPLQHNPGSMAHMHHQILIMLVIPKERLYTKSDCTPSASL